ncbi:uncharacterized conserved protein [Longilinea arvoryzae]|uniref:Uncharacterized conserved protein n=1 Tax=Longilinea arvoryzae TaxID=360412 RepID=A0A0S7BKD1_9CHLR|nr:sulfite exporter TauE/SafE family protein [Longilinea arvoryzae]GAP14792.1 uncharacterized conserved protein [Longilinea arvoryzae]
MVDYLAAFITGLTTGGLSCLAVQGGLLTSSIARQVEKDVERSIASKAGKKGRQTEGARDGSIQNGRSAAAILIFLLAKLAVYTGVGFLLGWVGSAFQLTPTVRGWFQLAIGAFMLGNALRMLNVHPIFRYFSFEPPSFITRFIRRTARNSRDDFVTPAFLGLLTVFIPCGVTQAIMALALGAGHPVQGALLMFAFTLGTSPVFFVLAYLFTRLGTRLERGFLTLTAVLVLALGLISMDSGLNLLGSPVSITRLISPNSAQQASLVGGNESAVVQIHVENSRYSPNIIYAQAGVPIRLELVTDDVHSCARAFTIPALEIAKLLPASGTEIVEIPPQKAGKLTFTCSMGMYTGEIVFQ